MEEFVELKKIDFELAESRKEIWKNKSLQCSII